jgi:hypothetical protein
MAAHATVPPAPGEAWVGTYALTVLQAAPASWKPLDALLVPAIMADKELAALLEA